MREADTLQQRDQPQNRDDRLHYACRKTVNWTRMKGVSGYRVYRSYSANSGYSLLKTLPASATSIRLTGLTATRRYIAIIPYKTVKGVKYNLPYDVFSVYRKYY